MMRNSPCLLVASLLTLVGCIRAPDIVLVDRHTALEEQAAGRLPAAEMEAAQAAVSAGPAPLTSGQLARSGWHSESGHDAIAALYGDTLDPSALSDQLLQRRCIGEALDATLVATPASCSGAADLSEISRLLERSNRNRRQVWLYLQANRPGSDLDTVRATWRQQQLQSLVCGGQLQRPDGRWEVKTCK